MADSLTTTISAKILRNTFFNSIGRFWGMLISVALTPYVLSRLGLGRFGIWSLILTITAYLELFDLGTRTAFVKYVAEYHAQEEYGSLNDLITTGLVTNLVVVVLVVGLIVPLNGEILHFFNIPLSVRGEARFTLLAVATSLVILLTSYAFRGVVKGLQRMDIINLIVIATSIPNVVGTVLSLELGYGLRGLALNRVVVSIIEGGLVAVYSFKLLPQLRVSVSHLSIGELRRLLKYGLRIQVTNLGGWAGLHLDKVLIARFLSLDLVALYELGFKVAYMATFLPLVLVSAFVPAISELKAKGAEVLIKRLYDRGSKYLILIAVPMVFFVALNAPLILEVWVRSTARESIWAVQLLSLAFGVNLLTAVGTTISRGIGRPGYETRFGLLTLLVHVTLGLICVWFFGFMGVLIASLASMAVGFIYFMNLFHRELRRPFCPFALTTYSAPLLAGLLAALSVCLLERGFSSLCPSQSWLANWGLLAARGGVFMAVYVALVVKTHYLDLSEISSLFRSCLGRGIPSCNL